MSTPPFCPNCYRPEPGDYCPQCGQKQAERRLTVKQLVIEFMDDQFGVNRRLPKTLKLLLFKPGFLTAEYFEGRVQQYIPPIRLYLVTSLVFFALFLTTDSANVSVRRERREFQEELQRDTALQRRVQTGRARGPMIGVTIDPADTTNWLEHPDVNLFGIERFNQAAEQRIKEFSVYGEEEGTRRFVRSIIAEMPKVFFVLLPLYAFLLWVFFRKQRKYYVEHFIMGLHLHAFGFVALMLLPLLDMPFLPAWGKSVSDIISPFVLLWVVIYIFFALQRVYRQSWLVTGLKYFFLLILYSVFFAVGVVLSGVLALTSV
jgi:hypothetical protein